MNYLQSKAWEQARMALARKRQQQGFVINPYAFGGSPPTDPNFANVVSLVHFEDAPTGSTGPFVDQIAARAPGWTRFAVGPQTNDTIYRYGAFSINGASVGVSNPSHADWDLSADFTIEGSCYFASTAAFSGVYSRAPGAGNTFGGLLVFQNGVNLQFFSSSNGTSWDIASNATMGTLVVNTWHDWAVSRVGNNFYALFDGALGSTTNSSGTPIANGQAVAIGAMAADGSFGANCYHDEFRATKGVGRYTGAYTPTGPFPDS